jgi:hypothetical protein
MHQNDATPPEDKTKPKEGDLYWIDKEGTIRVVAVCIACTKLILVPWTATPCKSQKCRGCRD